MAFATASRVFAVAPAPSCRHAGAQRPLLFRGVRGMAAFKTFGRRSLRLTGGLACVAATMLLRKGSTKSQWCGGLFLPAARSRGPGRVGRLAHGGRVAIVTGASAGVGKATVEGLAQSGAFGYIILAGRNERKHQEALEELRRLSGGCELVHLDLDLASLKQVKAFVESFKALRLPSLDVLILNAGVMMLPSKLVTEDGFERQMAVNHCGHFALVNLLLPLLVASGSGEEPSRVISLSSSAHLADCPLGNGQLGDLMWEENSYSPGAAYAQSKLANLLMVYELAKRAREDQLPLLVSAVHPGGVQTDLGRYLMEGMADPETGELQEKALTMPAWQEALIRGLVNTFITPKTPMEGAQTSLKLATCPPGESESGLYWEDEEPRPSLGKAFNPLSQGTSYDEEVWRAFWDLSEKWCKVQYSFQAPQS